jgi:hypothetical protein
VGTRWVHRGSLCRAGDCAPCGREHRRAVAYVRESTEEQGRGYSPDGQRQAIARYAEDHGLELIDEYLDFETGRAADKRPGFQRLIEDAMPGRFEAVLVFHTSRFAPSSCPLQRWVKSGSDGTRTRDLRRDRALGTRAFGSS